MKKKTKTKQKQKEKKKYIFRLKSQQSFEEKLLPAFL